MNKLICIIGPDGTGKSTQVNLLIYSLREKGINYEYRWLRFHHLFSLPILVLARLMGLSEVKTLENGDKIGYHYFYKSKIISQLYSLLLFLDTVIFTIVKVYIPLKVLNKNIVCDRFIYDTLIDLMVSTRNFDLYRSTTGKRFLSVLPKNSGSLMLIADENTLRDRREDIKYDMNLNLKINLYKKLAQKYKIPVINSNLPVNEVNMQILELINE